MKRLLLLCITILTAISLGCATAKVPDARVQLIWYQVKAEYPNENVSMPKVIWVDEDLYIRGENGKAFVNGVYSTTSKTVYLREWWADEDTVKHEFRHAHGDVLGEEAGELVFR